MTTTLVVDEHAAEEAEAQIRYYVEHAGPHIALRFAAEIEAIYQGLEEDRITGLNHPQAQFRLPIKRVLLDRFPFAVVFYVERETIYVVAIEALRRKPGYWVSRLR